MKTFGFLILLLLACTNVQASVINPTSQVIPTDPQLAFVALGGGIGGAAGLGLDVIGVKQWWVRVPVEVVEAFVFSYVAQAQTGAIRTSENNLNRATCAAFGGLGAFTIQWGAGR